VVYCKLGQEWGDVIYWESFSHMPDHSKQGSVNALITRHLNVSVLCFLLVISASIAYSQTEVIIGSGTSETGTTAASPVNNYYKSNHMQILYTADDLYNAGWAVADPGRISQIGFDVTEAPTLQSSSSGRLGSRLASKKQGRC